MAVIASSDPSPRTGNPWFAISMGLMGLIVGYTVATTNMGGLAGSGSAAVSNPPAAPSVPTVADQPPPVLGDPAEVDPETDHVRGNADAKISLIEYSDFECPFCQRNHPTMQQVLDTYGDDVNWVYRHFPLSFHPNAQKAAEASECAAELGGNDKFWEFADAVFAINTGLSNDAYVTVAKNIGLNEASFTECLDSGRHAEKVSAQLAEGSSAGVSGTPGHFIVNNETGEVFRPQSAAESIEGAVPFDRFKSAIDAMM